MQAEQKLKILQQVELFRDAPEEFLKEISNVLVEVGFDKGHTIIRKGDLDHEMFILVEGEVKVHDGDYEIARLNGYKVFGEYALFDTEPRSASITGTLPVKLWKLSREDFYQTLDKSPGMAQVVIAMLVNRLRDRTAQIIEEAKSREEKLQKQVDQKTSDLQKKNAELQNALEVLEQTRDQLIVKEKMASLGQLTAGIAHEIKNPLNFINNFSILSTELIDDIYEDLIAGKDSFTREDIEELKSILKDIKENSERVAGHGKRADEIVQGMLMHSRKTSSEKENVSINKVLKEALNLSYHGWRSKHSNFQADVLSNIPEQEVELPLFHSEISRAFLNILDNAFYAMNEFHKEKDSKSVLKVNLVDNGSEVKIDIQDNGPGINREVIDKLFEPFYTTKPAGSGTGLGLSLCYDIIVKAHTGSIDVISEPGEGTTFSITLPKNGTIKNSGS